MKIFIGCSSSDEISDEYKIVTNYLANSLSKYNDLVFGCTNRGLMSICYNAFLNNNRKIIGVCYEMNKDELNDLKLDETYIVKTLEESNRLLSEISDVILILPGAYGTLSEFFSILEEKRTNLHNKDIIIFNINGFYDGLINMMNLINKKVSSKYNFNNLCKVFTTVEEINNYINEKSSK